MTTAIMRDDIDMEIWHERNRQDGKWGEQNHDPFVWMTVLTEEVGEASQEALRMRFNENVGPQTIAKANFRKEMIQCAAVCKATIECMDRKEWEWGVHNPAKTDM